MKKSVYCRTVGKGLQAFYLKAGSKDYYLFEQKYRVSVKDYFEGGVDVNDIFSSKGKGGHALTRTKAKLPAYIRYIENEYNICVLNKTSRKQDSLSYRDKNVFRRERICTEYYESVV